MKWQPSAVALFAFAGGLLAGGCSVGPGYKRPDIPPPAQWREPAAASRYDRQTVALTVTEEPA